MQVNRGKVMGWCLWGAFWHILKRLKNVDYLFSSVLQVCVCNFFHILQILKKWCKLTKTEYKNGTYIIFTQVYKCQQITARCCMWIIFARYLVSFYIRLYFSMKRFLFHCILQWWWLWLSPETAHQENSRWGGTGFVLTLHHCTSFAYSRDLFVTEDGMRS